MKAFVQSVRQDSPYCIPLSCAAHWFWERGYEVESVTSGDLADEAFLQELRNGLNDSILRAVPDGVRLVLKRLGFTEPPLFDLPLSLSPWISRFTWESCLGQVREQVDSEISFNPFHIRPMDPRRSFKGTVVYGLRDLIPSASLPDDTPVLAQQKVEFISEWRAMVLRDRILHVAHLKGDPLRFPQPDTMLAALDAYLERPIAFGMDWGITAAGQSILIEINDGYSYGNHGLHGMAHVAMIEARWRQLVGLPDNGVGDCFSR